MEQLCCSGWNPRIIDDDTFDIVQSTLGTKGNARVSANPQRRRQVNNAYLLTGKLFCGKCHSPMTGVAGTGRHGGKYYYYVCKSQRQHACDKKPVRQNFIEEAVTRALKATVLTDEVIDILADLTIAYQSKNSTHIELDVLKARYADNQKSLHNILKAIEDGIYTDTTRNRLAELEKESNQLKAQISQLQKKCENNLKKEDIIAVLRLYKNGDVQDKVYQERLIDTFLVAAYINDDYLDLIFTIGDNRKEINIPFNVEDIDWSVFEAENRGSYKPKNGPP